MASVAQKWTDDLKTGLVHLWEFDGTAIDSVGGLNGTVTGNVLFVDGKMKQSAYFNGGYMNVAGNISLTDWTVSYWVKVAVERGAAGIIFRGTSSLALGFRLDMKKFNFCNNQAGAHNAYSANDILTVGNWCHVTARLSHSNTVIANGVTYGLTNYNLTALRIDSPMLIGADGYDPANRSLIGNLEQLAVWNRSLSDGEILLLYNNGKGLKY
jgi:hypothetical protein